MGKEQKDIKAIFSDAIEKHTHEERAAYLEKVCGKDAELRLKIEGLLKAHEQAGDFLAVPASDAKVTVDGTTQIEGPGTKIGRYELLSLIGEGGMGLVYLAEQKEPVKRKVALKIVKLGMDTKQVVALFEAERQTLAMLEHPNIAHVFDAGTTETGRPYFVMEYVEGKSITKYCDQQTLSVEERLGLFRQVCEGVHHAHQKGIIHRDIKPSNILITVRGQRAIPKIIDFGIAKAITQPLTGKTSYTEHGQLLGTPEYMSPEQAEMAYQDVDTRSDIYSLGVMLYELLAGATPFDAKRLREGGIDQIKRVICEEEPETPSARLTSLGDEGKTIAESRKTQIVTLTRCLHRELEWIPMKAMRKDRTRRYRSASELADDIQNYLTGTPLIAGPESTVYMARKFVRRHAGFVATAALLLVVMILGLVASIAMGARAEQAREKEAAARERAEQARDKEAALRTQVEQALTRAEKAEAAAEERNEEYRRALYVHSIQLADAKYRGGDVGNARTLLESCPEDLRGWEWDRVNHVLDHSLMSFSPHVWPWPSVAVSPDGKRIVCAGAVDRWANVTIKILDLATGKELTSRPEAHRGTIRHVEFSPDGKRIATCVQWGEVKVWDAADFNKPITSIIHSIGYTPCVSFSPDGNQIVSVSTTEGTIKVWDVATGTERLVLSGHKDGEGEVSFAAFSPKGNNIVSAGRDGIIKIWDSLRGDEKMSFQGHDDVIQTVSFNSDGSLFASGSNDKTIRIWNAKTGSLVETLYGHDGPINTVAFSPDDKTIISGSSDSTVRIWDVATGEGLRTLRGHAEGVTSVAFTPDGKQAVSGSNDKTIKVWDVNVDRGIKRFPGQGSMVSIAFSPDGKRLVSRSFDGNIKVWDVIRCSEILTLSEEVMNPFKTGSVFLGSIFYCDSVSFSPDGKQIALNDKIKGIVIRNAETGREITTLGDQEDDVRSLAYSPDGKRIVSGSFDGKIKLWDVDQGTELKTISEKGWRSRSIAFSPDGKQIVSGYNAGNVKVWDVASGTQLMSLSGYGMSRKVTFSPDGKRIASCSSSRATMWDAATGKELMILQGRGGRGELMSIAFSPDGRRLVTANADGTATIWDSSSGDELLRLHADSAVADIAFSPDGKSIAGGTEGKAIVLWESAAPADD